MHTRLTEHVLWQMIVRANACTRADVALRHDAGALTFGKK